MPPVVNPQMTELCSDVKSRVTGCRLTDVFGEAVIREAR